MIEFLLADVLERRDWTPYRLAQETGLTVPTAYRLADRARRHDFGRFTTDTLDRLCRALQIQPGELFRWVPETEPPVNGSRSAASRTSRQAARKRTG